MSRRCFLVVTTLAALVLAWAGQGLAETAQAGQEDGQRYCLRLLQVESQSQAQDLAARAAAGQPFAALARQLGPEARATARLRCLAASELSQEVLAGIGGLKPGQVSQPLSLGGKWLLVQRTTDEHWRLGQESYQAGRYQDAQEALLRDASLNPDGPAWQLLARSRAAAKDQEGALKALDMALVWAPEDAGLLHEKASLLEALGRREEALGQFEKALTLRPDNPTLLQNVAWLLVRQNQGLERAETLARRAARLEPQLPGHWDTLGLAQQTQGKHAAAAASYYQALKLEPELPSAKANLLKCLLALDRATLASLLSQGPASSAPVPQPARARRP